MKVKITEEQVCKEGDICRSTLNNWKLKHPKIIECIYTTVLARQIINSNVISSSIKSMKGD